MTRPVPAGIAGSGFLSWLGCCSAIPVPTNTQSELTVDFEFSDEFLQMAGRLALADFFTADAVKTEHLGN